MSEKKTRTEEVREIFKEETKKQEQWQDSSSRLQSAIDNWVGGGPAG